MRWQWVFFIILLFAGVAVWSVTKTRRTTPLEVVHPNILLISLDTLRPDHLGCYGYDKKTSPHLDRFAQQSVRFTNCRAQAPWTLPSHMALFTSMLPSENGVDNINKVLPSDIATLPELLHGEGYRTAALVNNGQMRAHWGFARGFDTWREFEADTPTGNCQNITGEAIDWLKSVQRDAPFFLFLHYYDAHEPYAAPDLYRKQMGTSLTGPETRKLCFSNRSPGRNFDDPKVLPDLIAAYDAEIAWLDHELGKLFAAIPENTLVVVFSDHGEAFKEHGWLLHGATLYEEEICVPLLIRPPTDRPGKIVNDPVMLLDVAPTILNQCRIQPPPTFQGTDLSALMGAGPDLQPRLIPSESKAVLEGQISYSVVLEPLKAIYSLCDGRVELYKLPDEQKPLGAADRVAADALFKPLRAWVESESYWMIHAWGEGDFEATVEWSEGRFSLYVPVAFDELKDQFDVLDDGRALRWHVYPGGANRSKALYLQPTNPDAALRVDCKINGERVTKMVFLGKDQLHPETLPATIPAGLTPVSPWIEKPFTADQAGFYVFRHRTERSHARPGRVGPLDEPTIRQLRSLGYLR